jgi:hypothetical protein
VATSTIIAIYIVFLAAVLAVDVAAKRRAARGNPIERQSVDELRARLPHRRSRLRARREAALQACRELIRRTENDLGISRGEG